MPVRQAKSKNGLPLSYFPFEKTMLGDPSSVYWDLFTSSYTPAYFFAACSKPFKTGTPIDWPVSFLWPSLRFLLAWRILLRPVLAFARNSCPFIVSPLMPNLTGTPRSSSTDSPSI